MIEDPMTKCILHGGKRRVAHGCIGHVPDPEVPFPMSIRRQVYAIVMYDEGIDEWSIEPEVRINGEDSVVWVETEWDDGRQDAGWDVHDGDEELIKEVYADLGARLAGPMVRGEDKGDNDA